MIQIREARREGVKLLIGLAGESGSGKTYSALQLGYGLAGKVGKKLGLLDTENKRGSIYADSLPGKDRFLIADMYPPFSPARLTAAIKEFEKAGVDVVVLDSFTHFWESEGGAKDIAEAAMETKKVPDWIRAKAEWKKMMNQLLMANCHVIVCMRARERVKVETIKGKLTYVPLGLQMITEKNAPFEMTASLMLHDSGKRQDVLKCPADLMHILGRGTGYLTVEDGLALRQWFSEAEPAINPKVEQYRSRFQQVSEQGLAAVMDAISKSPQQILDALGDEFFAGIKASAQEHDKQAEPAQGGGG